MTFNEDQSRLRAGHGAKNMAVVRHFALNLVRQVADKRSIKRRRKRAAWDPKYLLEILGLLRCYPRLVALRPDRLSKPRPAGGPPPPHLRRELFPGGRAEVIT